MSMDNLILRYFCQRIFKIFGIPNKSTAKLKRRWRVATTAVYYYRKFYSSHSLIDFDPRLLMVCCIFLAGKTEEHYKHFVHLKELEGICNPYPQKAVLDMEILLIEGLGFQLGVSHALNCMNSIVADWKRNVLEKFSILGKIIETSLISTVTSEWLANAEYVLVDLQTTRAIVDCSATTLALCALLVAEALPEEWNPQVSFANYLNVKFDESEITAALNEVKNAMTYVEEGQADIDINTLCNYMIELKNSSKWGITLHETMNT